MMADSAEETNDETHHVERSQPYVSCIRIFGRPILPPVMTAERRDEMQHYKGLAEQVEVKLHKRKSLIPQSSLSRSAVEEIVKKTTPVVAAELEKLSHVNTSSKYVDTLEILEEFDPFAPSSCTSENTRMKCRQSGSTDEFSKTGSSDDSVAMTNSTDLYHYMDITGSSLGDGRSTRRSLTPVPDGDWNAAPNKASGDQQIKATYEDLNEYLDSILISSASSPPSRAKSSDQEVTPTNEHLCESLQLIRLDDDKRPKSCPLSPIPREPIPQSAHETPSENLVEIGEISKPEIEKPRLVRSNSYTLDTPSPMLLAHLEAEKKKIGPSKPTDAKEKVVNRNKVSVVVKRSAGTKRGEVHLSGSRLSGSTAAHSPPKKAKNPPPSKSPPAKPATALIEQPELRKLLADLQAEHNRQMEELLRRQRKEQEMIREAILGQQISPEAPPTWAQYLGTNTAQVQSKQDDIVPEQVGSLLHPRKCLSYSFILSQVTSKEYDRTMCLSAPAGSLVTANPKRPSSSPASTTIPVSSAARDTNGNLTNDNTTIPRQETAFISQLLALSQPESALADNERVRLDEASPRSKRRVWTSQAEAHDPDWLQLSRQRQMHWAASKIQAGVRGYLTRRLLRTERVQGCITVIHDTILCALELQKDCSGNIEPSDLQLHGRLIHQLTDACREIHGIFVELPVAKRMAIIAMDRERLLNRSPRNGGPRPLSRATQIALTRKMARNNADSPRSAVSTTRRKNWANSNKGKASIQDACEIVPSCLSRSSTTPNGDPQRTVNGGGGPRKPWR